MSIPILRWEWLTDTRRELCLGKLVLGEIVLKPSANEWSAWSEIGRQHRTGLSQADAEAWVEGIVFPALINAVAQLQARGEKKARGEK